jgi:L-aminopeptidase/D-esterase-like protein
MECLAADRVVEHIHAIVLSGGSGFGLDAATGVQAWLREQGRGLIVGGARVPIVPQAICFDLLNGGDKDWGRFPPYRELGYTAAETASATNLKIGSVGGGIGATTVNYKGGIGSASAQTSSGSTVAAMILVNALGSATVGDGPHFWAGPLEEGAEFGGHGPALAISREDRALAWKGGPTGIGMTAAAPPHATTIGVVATDAALTKAEAQRLAIAAHDGYARALRLTHALFDGDMLFAVSTGKAPRPATPGDHIELAAIAADCVARAIARGVFSATRPGPRYTGPQPYSEAFPT